MAKLGFHRRILPAVNLTEFELSAIEQALTPEFADATQWNMWAPHVAVTCSNVEELLTDAKDVRHLTDFEIIADIPDASITVAGGEAGCFLEYQHSAALAVVITAKARGIEGIFHESRRRSAHIPSPITALPGIRRLTRSPCIKVGAPGFQLEIDWSKMAQAVITNWLSHLGTGIIAFALGLLIGWLGS
jgi:hypothetical protein